MRRKPTSYMAVYDTYNFFGLFFGNDRGKGKILSEDDLSLILTLKNKYINKIKRQL